MAQAKHFIFVNHILIPSMFNLKTFRVQKTLYPIGMALLIMGVLSFGAILTYAFLNVDQYTNIDTTLSSMSGSVFAAISLMILGTILRGVKNN